MVRVRMGNCPAIPRQGQQMTTTNHTSPSGEDAANGAMPDTGNAEADRIINRLSSSDPDFDDCIDAVAFIRKLVAEHKGPEGFATWKDAALDERHRRLAAEKRSEERRVGKECRSR